jgi:hypothetical protein
MAMQPARVLRVWGAAVLVAGTLLLGAAPASAATTAGAASPAAVTTSTLQAPTLQCVNICGQEFQMGWTFVSGVNHYELFADGEFQFSSWLTADSFYAVSWDPNETWTVRAVDDSGNVSAMSNGLQGRYGCG